MVSNLLIDSLYTSVNQHIKEFQQGYLFTYNPFGCLLFSTCFLFWILTFFFFFLPLVFTGWIVMLYLLLFIFTARLTLAVSKPLLSVKKTSALCYGQCCCLLFLEKSNREYKEPAFFPAHLNNDFSSSDSLQKMASSKLSLWHSTGLSTLCLDLAFQFKRVLIQSAELLPSSIIF